MRVWKGMRRGHIGPILLRGCAPDLGQHGWLGALHGLNADLGGCGPTSLCMLEQMRRGMRRGMRWMLRLKVLILVLRRWWLNLCLWWGRELKLCLCLWLRFGLAFVIHLDKHFFRVVTACSRGRSRSRSRMRGYSVAGFGL